MLNQPKKFENMKKYEHIIHLAHDTKAASPPDGFTEKVMENLPPDPHTVKPKLLNYISLVFNNNNMRDWIEVETGTECAFCFLMAGFFYFIVGIVLAFGLKTFGNHIPVSGWFMLQPQIAFGSAFVFFSIGVVLLKRSLFAIKIAHSWTIIYIGFSIFNSIGIQMAPQNPFSVIGMLCLTTGAVLLGFFLAVIVQKYKEMVAYDDDYMRT